MNYLEEEDIHFCLRCRQTILGLDAYVSHRTENNCRPETIDKPNHSTSDNRQSETAQGSGNNDNIDKSNAISTAKEVGNIVQTSVVPQEQNDTLNRDDVDPSLKADDFFSLLELQSSTKTGSCPVAVPDLSLKEEKIRNVQNGMGVVTRSRSRRIGGRAKDKCDDSQGNGGKTKKKMGQKMRGTNTMMGNTKKRKVTSKKASVEVLGMSLEDFESTTVEGKDCVQEKSDRVGENSKNSEKEMSVLFCDLPQTDSTISNSSVTPGERFSPVEGAEILDQRIEEEQQEGREVGDVDDDDDYDEEEEEEEPDAPPRSYGGKWKPGSSPSIHQQRSVSLASVSWNEVEGTSSQLSLGSSWRMEHPNVGDVQRNKLFSQKHQSMPPPGHTRGKWIPFANDPSTLRRSGNRVQYWCGVCNRRLSSRGLYERHLMSPLHARRTRQERQLDEDIHEERSATRRPPRLARKLQEAGSSSKRGSTSIAAGKASLKQDGKKSGKSIVCPICGARVARHQMGKHLVSRFHCKRAAGQPSAANAALIAANAASVARQAPFRCALCRFYCNTIEALLFHWDSQMHADKDAEVTGRYWCSLCKHFDDSSSGMREHLVSKEHQEVVAVINRSFPIEIQKLITLKCEDPGCERTFRFNSQLRLHSRLTGHRQSTGSASDLYQDRSKCGLCSYVAHSERRLQKHMAIRHKIRNFFCSECGLKFGTKEEALVHRRSKQHKYTIQRKRKDPSQLVRSCPYCSEIQPDVMALRKHLAETHPEKAHRCAKCGESFTLKQELSRHVRDDCKRLSGESGAKESDVTATPTIIDNVTATTPITGDVTATTPITGDVTATTPITGDVTATTPITGDVTTSSAITGDNLEDSGLRCAKCSFSSTSRTELLYHTALHGEPITEATAEGSKSSHVLKYVCPLCPRPMRKDCLKNHLKTHTGEKQFSCVECLAVFARADVLSKHRRLVHRSEARCHICDVIFSCPSSLRRHLESHIEQRVKDHHCPECGLAFYDKTALKQHMLVHTGKTVLCHFADCVFKCRTSTELNYHLRTHSDLRPFSCEHCDYAAKTKAQLSRHIKRHLGKDGRDYSCSHCTFKAMTYSKLKRHLRLHTGSKPYHCPHCNYACNLQENLRKHVLSTKKHPGKHLYSCQEENCDFKSNSSKDFRVHLVSVHDKKASVATSYISGLYRYNEDTVQEAPMPSNSKPKDPALLTSHTSSSTASSDLVLSPLLGSTLHTLHDPPLPAAVLVTEPITDDIIFIHLPPTDDVPTLGTDASFDAFAPSPSPSDHFGAERHLFFESHPTTQVSEQEFVIIDESATIELVSSENN